MNICIKKVAVADFLPAANVSILRIEKRLARFEQHASDGASTNKVFELGQLCASVDSRFFPHVQMLRKTDAFVGPFQDRRDIGQVVFALAVRGPYFFQGAEEFFAVETINA